MTKPYQSYLINKYFITNIRKNIHLVEKSIKNALNYHSIPDIVVITYYFYHYYCTASLQNLAVQQDFYSPLGVPLERSCWPRIRWCGTCGFQEQGQCFFIGLSCSIPTLVFYSLSLSLLSVYRLVLWGWGFRTDRVYITLSQPCTADLF